MKGAVALAGFLLAAGPPPSPIASFEDLGATLTACIRGDAPAAGLELDLTFALSVRGTVLGRPSVVTKATAPMAAQRSVTAAMLDALRRCTPFVLAPDFAAAIAGKRLTIHVLTGGRAIVV